MTPLARTNVVALAVPGLLMAGALGWQYLGGLYPCEMCHWQRWPHEAAIALAILAFFLHTPARRIFIALAAVGIVISGAIGAFHAGVEYGWWEGLTTCSNTARGSSLSDIMSAPLIRCDVAQWSLFGVSLAGFNAIFSIVGGITVFAMLRKAA